MEGDYKPRLRRTIPLKASRRMQSEDAILSGMDESRKRVIGIMAAILASLHMRTADDLFGTPQGSPRTDRLIAASIQWAERIMQKIDDAFGIRCIEGRFDACMHPPPRGA